MAINKKDYSLYSPFKLWTIENFPFIEADFVAITNYQLWSKILEQMRKLCENQTKLQQSQNEVIDAFNNLEKYVEDYFADLDVQEEINNKLDEMAESGELAQIISQFLNLNVCFGFDTISDMADSENLIEGSICKTLGASSVTDGKGRFYRIRTYTISDVIDGFNIVALNNSETLIAEVIRENKISYYSTVSDMVDGYDVVNGSVCLTLGYHAENDGGGCFYKIRTKTVDDVVDNGSIIEIDENLVAEGIFDNCVNIKKFGCYGDNEHDDTDQLQNAINYATSNNKKLIIDEGTFLIDGIELDGTINIEGVNNLKSILKVKNTSTSDGCIIINDSGFENSIINNLVINVNNVSNCNGIYSRPTTSRSNNNLMLKNLRIYNANNGIDIYPTNQLNNIGTTISNVIIAGCSKNGINIKGTDLVFEDIISYINTEAGIKCEVYSSKFSNIKCYQNGKGDYSTLEDESRINPLASGTYYKKYAGIISKAYNSTFSQIDLQENAGDGIYAEGYNNIYTGINVDNNGYLDNGVNKFTPISYESQNLTPIYDGIYFKNHNMVIVSCLCTNMHYGTVGAQQRGALFFDTSSYCKADIIGGNQYENKNYRYKSTNSLEVSNNTNIEGTDVDLTSLTLPSNYQFNTGSFIRKVGNKKQYHLIIKKTSGNFTDGETISGIPTDYRPAENTFVQSLASDNNGWSGYQILRYQILTSGSIVLKQPSGNCNFAVLDLII